LAHEIERKFLVAGEGWREAAVRCERLVDGLLATSKGRKVRVRLYEDRATLTIKTGKKGRLRLEFEYDIPRVDAEHLMARECGASVVAKTRHFVPHEGFTWEVDVYEGVLQGVVLAEVELASVDQDPPRPAWVGREVTEDPAFRKQRLFVEALRRSFSEPTRAAKPRQTKTRSGKSKRAAKVREGAGAGDG
jgi:CYTH domain-containing protein